MENERVNENDNVYRFYKPKKINFTLIIVLVVLFYVIIVGIIYLRKTHVVRYEVVEGSLASSTIYRGLIIRQEDIIDSNYAGYINYLARDGQRVAVGDLVYTVDETGSLNNYIASINQGENYLSASELSEFRTDIINFVHSYDSSDYDDVYNFKYSLNNSVLKLANAKLLSNIDEASAGGSAVSLKYCYSGYTGIVSYWYDGFENIDLADVSKNSFDEKKYERVQLLSNELHASGEPVFKLTKSENWSIIIPVSSKKIAESLLEEDYILVKFLKTQDESWAKVSIQENADGYYVQLSFTNSMISFVNERYIDIELELGEETGLKIPVSSIAEKEFFLVDDDYVTEDSNDKYTVLMQVYNEDGSRQASAVSLEVYYYDDKAGVYYVDNSVLSAGDLLYGNNETTFVVKDKGTLIGVYNINKGYADFKQITILYQNDEYAIVKSNTAYGLRVYDYIALDSDTVSDDQFISQSK